MSKLPVVVQRALSTSYLPHGFCYLWNRQLVLTHVVADGLIWIAYMAISIVLGVIACRYRRQAIFPWVLGAFGVFIVACGFTHFIEIVVLWKPYYWLSADIKVFTALASVTTGAALPFWVPKLDRFVRDAYSSKLDAERFLAASNSSSDSFYILESVRNDDAEIVDFRFVFSNDHGAALMSTTQEELAGKLLCENYPFSRAEGFFDKYKAVTETGEPLTEEVPIEEDDVDASWLRYHVVKLDDGVAISVTNLSKNISSSRSLAFHRALILSSPFAMIAVRRDGIISEMNPAAEHLLGYSKEELVGKASPLALHDPEEVKKRALELTQEFGSHVQPNFDVFKVRALRELTEDEEWTYLRKDGSRILVQLVVSPLRDESGKLLGLLMAAHDITERKRVEEYISYAAHHDALTGLPTRTLLRDRLRMALNRASRAKMSVALLMVDLDNFKRINDSLGHHAGDEVLMAVASRLTSTLRKSDTVARMGGDEFVVMLEGIQSPGEAEVITQKLLSALNQPIEINGDSQLVTASVGICMYPQCADDDETLLRNADAAMYFAKEDGRNSYQVFSDSMAKASINRRAMQSALDVALSQQEFQLAYQPQVSLTTGEVIGIEALLRWHSKKLGTVSPADFIPLAEESGLIVSIGEWVLRTACRDVARFNTSLKRPIVCGVNLSPRQFQQGNLVRIVEEALKDSGLAPSLLELEITENVLVSDSPKALNTLAQIRALGVRLSIDDFGTGFSSMSYILRFKVDRIKIDQSFIRNITSDQNSGAVAHAIIALAHGLKISVIAEGVETFAICDLLMREGCDEAQGYFYSPAVALEKLPEVFAEMERARSSGPVGESAADRL